MVLLIGAAGVWVWEGEVATTVKGQAVILRTGGMISVTSQGAGQIVWLGVGVGDKVKANQVIVRIPHREAGARWASEANPPNHKWPRLTDRANLRRDITELTPTSGRYARTVLEREQALGWHCASLAWVSAGCNEPTNPGFVQW